MDEWRSMTEKEQGDQWRLLLDKEYELRAKLKEGSPASDIREWWCVVEKVFGRLGIIQLPAPEPLPTGLFYTMYGLTGHLAVGDMPEAIADVKGPGHTARTPSERRDKRWAVTYREAVKLGIIQDRHPTRTIMREYGMKSGSAVRKWSREYKPFNDDLKIDDKDDAAVAIDLLFRRAGKSYRVRNSRTEEAAWRGKKVKNSLKTRDKSEG